MKTIRTKVYQFDELNEQAQQVAIEWYRQGQQQDGDYLHFFSDDVSEKLKEHHIDMDKNGLFYSLSCCQGDGLSFSGSFDVSEMVKSALPTLSEKRQSIINELIYSIKSNADGGRYCFASKSQVDIEFNYNHFCEDKHNNLYSLCIEVLEHCKDLYMDLCRQFEQQGYDEIEYQDSDECIKENIKVNEYEFLASGKRFNY